MFSAPRWRFVSKPAQIADHAPVGADTLVAIWQPLRPLRELLEQSISGAIDGRDPFQVRSGWHPAGRVRETAWSEIRPLPPLWPTPHRISPSPGNKDDRKVDAPFGQLRLARVSAATLLPVRLGGISVGPPSAQKPAASSQLLNGSAELSITLHGQQDVQMGSA